MSNTRYAFTELATAQAVGTFSTGVTVTIALYDAVDGLAEPLDSAACTEIGTTGIFKWPLSNITTTPTAFKQFIYIMTDDSPSPVIRREMVDVGGWVQTLPTNLGPATTCKVILFAFEQTGDCPVDVSKLCADSFAQLTTAFVDASGRYFSVDQYKPAYDRLTGEVYWVLPQGSTAEFIVPTLGIEPIGKIIPAETTKLYKDLVDV